ncbi:MAG: hypothetical protein QN163_00560 [Armatimonadota bacterium]|nr:hypothetical protein [Armatimonadota bacterium]MDR5696723.1 hypothetical protein [Armatimonadota bacterium]
MAYQADKGPHPLAALVGVLATSVFAAHAGAATGGVVVTGHVLQGETGRPVAGAQVRVLGMETGQQPVERLTRTGADGRFTLRVDVLRRTYVIQTEYRGVVYTSGPHPADRRTLDATLRVYEVTDDPGGLYIARRALLVEQAEPHALDIREVVVVGNALPRTYVGQPEGDGRATLRLPLPAGAQGVSVRQGMAPLGLDAEGAVVDSLPITPGERQIVLTYRVPFRGTRVALRIPVQLPTLAADVFVAAPLSAHSDALPRREERTVQQRRVLRLAGANLPPGTTIELRLSGPTRPTANVLPAVGIATLALLVFWAAALPWLRTLRTPT